VLAEGGIAECPHQFGQGFVVFAIRVGEQHRRLAEFVRQALLPAFDVRPDARAPGGLIFPRPAPDQVIVAGGMVREGGAVKLHLAHLRPAHERGQALVHGIGGNEDGERPAASFQARPGLFIDREIGIIDGDGDGAVGDGLAAQQMIDDALQRPGLVTRGSQMLQMGIELFEPDIGGGIGRLAEAVVHEDHGARDLGARRARVQEGDKQGQRDESGAAAIAASPWPQHCKQSDPHPKILAHVMAPLLP